MLKRGSGILLHLTSLPSIFGVGDLGPEAYEFVDFLADAKQKYWQLLPLNPTDPVSGHSPYHSVSAFAFNPLLISPDLLCEDGWLDREEIISLPDYSRGFVDFKRAAQLKSKFLEISFQSFQKAGIRREFEKFIEENSTWLDDYALFAALKQYFRGRAWSEWPIDVRDRDPAALEVLRTELGKNIERHKFFQFIFFGQWARLKEYCRRKGIMILGDMPIYVVHDSVDVWAHPEIFKLDADKEPLAVAGVPPDYFSRTGQLWGNPLYRWDILKESGYEWWIRRLLHNINLFDLIRIDHFRGFVGFWEIPANEKTAVKGRWIKAPAMDFFGELFRRIPDLPVIAEDLGIITPDVHEVMKHFNIPGMKILLFAFGDDNSDHPYLPHTYPKNCLVYTGTHDNNTVKGWFQNEANPVERNRLSAYLGRQVEAEEAPWEFIKLGARSRADIFIVPIQDILGLGQEARMNLPGTKSGNWRWRVLPGMLGLGLADRLAELSEKTDRS